MSELTNTAFSWTKSPVGGTYFRFAPEGKYVLFPAAPGAEELVIFEALRCPKHGAVIACDGWEGGTVACDPSFPHCPKCGRAL